MAHSQAGSVESSQELAERLADAAPVLDTRHGQVQSLEARGYVSVDAAGRLGFRCWYERPDRRACHVYHDDVPIFVAVGDQIFAYGPLDGPVLFRGDWYVVFGHSKRDVGLVWGFLNLGNADSRTEIDVKSIVDHTRLRRSATSLGEKRYVLVGHTERGSTLEAWLDLMRPVPYVRLKGRSVDNVAGFEIEKLTVNEPVPAAAFRFPRFAETFGLTPTVATFDKLGDLVQRTMVSAFTRTGLRSSEMRAKLDSQFSQPLDWERLRSRDAAVAPVLKSLLAEYEGLP